MGDEVHTFSHGAAEAQAQASMQQLSAADVLVFSLDSRQVTLMVAGMATLLASNMCLNLISSHVQFWRRPKEQRRIVAIISMVPLFAVDSYFGLADMPGSEVVVTVLDSIKECYEAYVIHQFLGLLFSYLNVSQEPTAAVPDAIKSRELHNSFPLTLVLPKHMKADRKTLNLLLQLTRQFVLIRPVLSVAMCVLELLGVYHGAVAWVVALTLNASVYVAVYALLLFFHAFEKELARHRPLAKFLCIKGVVFFAFWQGLVVRLLTLYGIIHEGLMPYTVRQVEEAVQNFLVCVEMLGFAFAFQYAFTAKPYERLAPGGEDGGASARDIGEHSSASDLTSSTESKKEK